MTKNNWLVEGASDNTKWISFEDPVPEGWKATGKTDRDLDDRYKEIEKISAKPTQEKKAMNYLDGILDATGVTKDKIRETMAQELQGNTGIPDFGSATYSQMFSKYMHDPETLTEIKDMFIDAVMEKVFGTPGEKLGGPEVQAVKEFINEVMNSWKGGLRI